jgi:hypothetical protein
MVGLRSAVLLVIMTGACGAALLPDDLSALVQVMNEDSETRSVDATNKVWRTFGKKGLFQAVRAGGPIPRARAAFRLRDCTDSECERILIELLLQDDDTFVRTQAAWSLGTIGTTNALDALRKAALSTDKSLSQVATDSEAAIVKRSEASPRR